MIHPKAINQFIKRERDRHDWIKKIVAKDLDAELLQVQHRPLASPEPFFVHQRACFLLGVAYPKFAFWMEPGTGKSRLALELLRHWQAEGKLKVALILAASETAIVEWENEHAHWGIEIPYVSLFNSSSKDKWEKVADIESGIIIATYAGFVRMLSTAKPHKKDPTKTKLTPNPTLINRFRKKINTLVMDESSASAHRESLVYRLCYQFSKTVDFLYQLDGHPLGRDPTALWSQLKLIDKGWALGETLGLYRAALFEEKKNYWGGLEYKFPKENEPTLQRFIKHRSISYLTSECVDLPKLVQSIVEVKLPYTAEAYCASFIKHVKQTRGGLVERKSAFLRMRQVSSGFVGFMDDETGEKAEVEFDVNPKLDKLVQLIQQIPEGEKFIVFHEFTHSGRLICKALKAAGIEHVWLWGGCANKRSARRKFQTLEHIKGMVLNHRLGARSLNLQRANHVIYFESPVPVIARVQSQRRCHRAGQLRTVYMTDLVCQGTADTHILEFHRTGAALYGALFDQPAAPRQGPIRRKAA